MGKYFDVNGTAMVYISIDKAKSKDNANLHIAKACQTIKESFKSNLQQLAKEQPDIFDPISFDGFYLPGLDIHVFQNQAHGPSSSVNLKHVHTTATLTINGTFETNDYDEHLQLIINTFKKTFDTDDHALFRLNLITMWNGQQDATIFDNNRNIITIPLLKG